MGKTDISRRDFAGQVAGAAAFTIVPRHVLGRGYRAPSDTLNIACIGVGGMGRTDVDGVNSENIYALCDVDLKAAEGAFRAYPKAKQYRDYRVLFEREAKHFDAVTVSTPDHSHAAAAMLALKHGKPVYCQKPLARTMGEVRALRQQAARTKVATQMGNQGHTNEGTRQIREWLEAGVLGSVREVHYWTNRPIWPQGLDRPTEAHNPAPTLDWNLWQGPAAERPYHPAYAPFRWRGWWDFGTGALGDMACHGMDAAFWALDLGYPTSVSGECTTLYQETAPKASRVTYQFPARQGRGPVTVVWRDGSLAPPRPAELAATEPWPLWDIGGQLWLGERASLIAGMYGDNPRLLDPAKDQELRAALPAVVYPRSPGVYQEWIGACKGGAPALSAFDGHAGALTEMVLLGVIAARLGSTITVNPATGEILSPAVPAEWLVPVYRAGWGL